MQPLMQAHTWALDSGVWFLLTVGGWTGRPHTQREEAIDQTTQQGNSWAEDAAQLTGL